MMMRVKEIRCTIQKKKHNRIYIFPPLSMECLLFIISVSSSNAAIIIIMELVKKTLSNIIYQITVGSVKGFSLS